MSFDQRSLSESSICNIFQCNLYDSTVQLIRWHPIAEEYGSPLCECDRLCLCRPDWQVSLFRRSATIVSDSVQPPILFLIVSNLPLSYLAFLESLICSLVSQSRRKAFCFSVSPISTLPLNSALLVEHNGDLRSLIHR